MKFLICSKLDRIWFFFWFLGISIYLLSKAIKRYLEFKTWQFDAVYERDFDPYVIAMYLTAIIVAIASGVCCSICIMVQTGNYANDSWQFGVGALDFKSMRLQLHREQMGNAIMHQNHELPIKFWTRMKHHFPAFFSSFYFIMSVSFCIILPYLDSEKIRYDLEPSDRIFHTNLDLFFNPNSNFDQKIYTEPISPEFFNLCICLVIHAFSYSSVFWKFNKFFSFLFAIVLFFNGLVFLFDFALVEMLVKLSRYSQNLDPSMKFEFPWTPLLSILSLASYLLMLTMQLSLFEYGFSRIKDSLVHRRASDINDNCTTYNNSSNISVKLGYVWKQLCIDSWSGIMLPFVIGIICSVFSILVRLPYLLKIMRIKYDGFNMSIVLANGIIAILYFITMLIFWICLIFKSYWPIKDYVDPVATSNGDCQMYVSQRNSEVMTIPVYASVNRHPSLSPPVDQEPNFPLFCDKVATQWRYSCSPPSCHPNDSNSNSDATMSGKNQDIGNGKKNYIYLSRINPSMDSPNFNQGIYSQLVKLTPQLSLTDNPIQSEISTAPLALSNDASENSSNQTVHIIGSTPIDFPRRTIERSSLRNRPEINSDVATPEYFNIFTTNTSLQLRQYEPVPTNVTDVESNNLCTQV